MHKVYLEWGGEVGGELVPGSFKCRVCLVIYGSAAYFFFLMVNFLRSFDLGQDGGVLRTKTSSCDVWSVV